VIMDAGTGSGRWAIDMSLAFPWTSVVGVDLVPPSHIPKDKIPQNCRFEVDDLNLSLEHYTNNFSVIHDRMMEQGLNDAESFMYEAARALKPGGILMIVHGDIQYWTEDFEPFPWVEPGEPGFYWIQYIVGHAFLSYRQRGGTGGNGCMWFKEALEGNPNYSAVHEEEMFLPMGPWKEGMNEREILGSNLLREALARVVLGWKPYLLNCGHREEDIDLWATECARELREMSKRAYIRFFSVGAVRADTPWQEREITATPPDYAARSPIKGLDLVKAQMRPEGPSA